MIHISVPRLYKFRNNIDRCIKKLESVFIFSDFNFKENEPMGNQMTLVLKSAHQEERL